MRPGWVRFRTSGAGFAFAVGLEILYILGRALIHAWQPEETPRELFVDLWRLVFIVLYAPFIDWHVAAQKARVVPLHPLLIALVAIDFVAIGSSARGWSPLSFLYATTAPFPGAREEMFYRGILQSYLTRKMGLAAGVGIASIAFAALHFGSQPMNIVSISMLLSAGVLFGLIYARTGNIWLVIGLHTIADVWAAIIPAWARLPYPTVLFVSVAVILGALLWYDLDRTKQALGLRDDEA